MCAYQRQKQPIWQPNENSGKRMKAFIKSIEVKYTLKFNDYWDFHNWTVENTSEFWAEIWNFSGVIYSKPYDNVVDLSIPMEESPKWFEGARLNVAENLLKYRDDRTAVITTGEDRGVERFSFKELFEETRIYATALRKLGLQVGDRVACYMSNRIEGLVAMLAVTSIGAVWTGICPNLGPEAFLKRAKQVMPKFLFTIDQFQQNKVMFHLLENIKEIVNGLPSLEKVIIVPAKKITSHGSVCEIKNSCFLEDFKRMAYESDGTLPKLVFEQVSFSHPAFINYTSGSTGFSKAIVHGFGGLLSNFRDYGLHWNGKRNDVWLTTSPVGWTSWNNTFTLLFLGSTIILFEGVPYHLSSTFIWDLVDDLKITKLNIHPAALQKMDDENCVPTVKHHLSCLKAIRSGGSVVTSRNYRFALNKVRKGLGFLVRHGSTEARGFCVTEQTLPIYLGEISSPCLGVALECLDVEGNHLIGEIGEFAIYKPLPSLPLKLWGDTTGEQYKKTYFSKFPGKFTIGDSIAINPETNGITVYGRSDEILTQSGCRFSSSEIYHLVKMFPEIKDCLCVGKFSKDGDEKVVLFIEMKDAALFNEDLKFRLRKNIANKLTERHVPKFILQTPGVPYNPGLKKTEVIIKNIINKLPHDTDSIINPECLQFYYSTPELENV